MSSGSPVLLPLRIWLVAEVAFALGAMLSITIAPEATATNFAWPIQPVVAAAVIGAFYAAVAPTLVMAVFARRWEMVRVIVIPGAIFTGALLLATHLHWDRFRVGTTQFWVWYLSYILPPPIFAVMYVIQERRSREAGSGEPLPAGIRTALAILGGLLTAECAYAFYNPAWFAADFPWKLTPLVARVLAGFLLAVSTMMLSMAWENDTDRVRIAAPVLVLALPAVAIQLARYPAGVDWRHWRLIVIVALLAVVMAIGVRLCRGGFRRSLS